MAGAALRGAGRRRARYDRGVTSRSRIVWAFVVAAAIVFALARSVATLYVNKLWFQSLGDIAVFWRVITARLELGVPAGLLAFLFLLANLLAVRADLRGAAEVGDRWMHGRRLAWVLTGVAAVAGALTGWAASGSWPLLFRYLDQVPFGLKDPVFHRDVAFYVFTLPLLRWVYGFAWIMLVIGAAGAAGLYSLMGLLRMDPGRLVLHPRTRRHLALLAMFALLLKAWGYVLDGYGLLNSTRGVVAGASYTDVHASLPAFRILAVLALVAAVIAAANVVRDWLRPLAVAPVGVLAASVLIGTIYPALVQSFVVNPTELQREAPYIARSIAFTRRAYNLDLIKTEPFVPRTDLTATDLAAASDTTQNMRLWSESVTSADFQQEQALRSYYAFDPVTVDRYMIAGHEREVLLSAREIDYGNLAAPTWVNEHLKYTHGYGAAMVPAAASSGTGLPKYWLSDIPPTSPVGLRLTRPQIYYGEAPSLPYAIVDTATREFDYPSGQRDVYRNYAASQGGIPIGPMLNRVAFALREDNYNILHSGDILPSSRALILRNVLTRVEQVAPYLHYEPSPYLVVYRGGLYWIVDAYTESATFPYSQRAPGGSYNYIRNSVKVVVNAYTGQMTFYAIDPTDPIVRTYERIFPHLYQPLSAMPAGLRAHLRYPQGMFQVQMELYATFHMTDPTVFYNREDLWTPSNEIVGNQQAPSRPYYVILQLPGAKSAEFLLMEPFTPYGHDNMIAWVAARSDPAHYGQMIAYEFPKTQLTLGPLQVDAQINQDPAVAQDLTLWSHGGSNVLRGRLLAIPVHGALLYVEPIYQEATGAPLPELRRVIVAYGNNIGFAASLQGALSGIFGGSPPAVVAITSPPATASATPPATASASASATASASPAQRAMSEYAAALSSLRQGNFAAFGSAWRKLGTALKLLPAGGG